MIGQEPSYINQCQPSNPFLLGAHRSMLLHPVDDSFLFLLEKIDLHQSKLLLISGPCPINEAPFLSLLRKWYFIKHTVVPIYGVNQSWIMDIQENDRCIEHRYVPLIIFP